MQELLSDFSPASPTHLLVPSPTYRDWLKENGSHSLARLTLHSTNIYIQFYELTEPVNVTVTMNDTEVLVSTEVTGVRVT